MNDLSFQHDSPDEKKALHLSPEVKDYSNECGSCPLAESAVARKLDFGESLWKAWTGRVEQLRKFEGLVRLKRGM